MKLTKAQVIFLFTVWLVLTYWLTALLCFALNDAIKMLPSKITIDFTLNALLTPYPKAYAALALAGLISLILVAIVPLMPRKKSLYGDARFANSAEVAKMGLYADDGIIIGKYNKKLLRFSGQQFVALGAPTRSGKGVGIVIPNLLDWKQSAVVQDIKQECFDYTSKYRAEKLGNEVFLFNPFDRRTHRYNPLHYIDMDGENADSELNDFANILYPTTGGNDASVFFAQQAQNLFIGLCYMCHDILSSENGINFLHHNNLECSFTLCGIFELSHGFEFDLEGSDLKTRVSGFKNTYDILCETGIIGSKAKYRINTYLNIKSDNTRSGVEATFNAPLMGFQADTMRLATSGNDFDFRDLRKKKMTIYIGITPDQLENARLILNIFWQQLILVNTKELPQANPELIYQVLLLEDEFTAPGYMPIVLKGVSFIAGYWLRMLMVYQSNSQLEAPQPNGYGREGAKTLLTNHACQIYYTPREQEDAEKISKMLGNTTVKNRSRNIGVGLKGGGGSESDTVRALMLPQELREMSFSDELITIDNGKPILCQKAFYYNDPYFMNKFKQVSKSLSKIKGIPSRKELESAIQNGETRIEVPRQSMDKLKEEQKSFLQSRQDKFNKGEGNE